MDLDDCIKDGFNPYRVFKFVATHRVRSIQWKVFKFQSLSGFQVRCNIDGRVHNAARNKFQSLSGFQVRCNGIIQGKVDVDNAVSIPIGFSSSLQLIANGMRIILMRSFNPYRVFKFVATFHPNSETWHLFIVSIPIGFSSSLQP